MDETMTEDEAILEAARSIRPFLKELIPDEETPVDRELSDYLAEASAGKNVRYALIETLRSRPATRQWVDKFLIEQKPPVTRRYQQIQGDRTPVSAPKYVCPQGDYNWYKISAGDQIPQCPSHRLRLVPAT